MSLSSAPKRVGSVRGTGAMASTSGLDAAAGRDELDQVGPVAGPEHQDAADHRRGDHAAAAHGDVLVDRAEAVHAAGQEHAEGDDLDGGAGAGVDQVRKE